MNYPIEKTKLTEAKASVKLHTYTKVLHLTNVIPLKIQLNLSYQEILNTVLEHHYNHRYKCVYNINKSTTRSAYLGQYHIWGVAHTCA